MELAVVIEPNRAGGFRASSGEPLPAAADGGTRDEALGRLRAMLTDRLAAGTEVVRLRLDPPAVAPVWPADPLTADWLAGIAAARRAADSAPSPWDEPAGDAP